MRTKKRKVIGERGESHRCRCGENQDSELNGKDESMSQQMNATTELIVEMEIPIETIGPLPIDLVSRPGMVLIYPPIEPDAADSLTDEEVLLASKELVARYPNHKVAMYCWIPLETRWPNTEKFWARRGYQIGYPAEIESQLARIIAGNRPADRKTGGHES